MCVQASLHLNMGMRVCVANVRTHKRGNTTVVTGEGGASFQASEFCLICQPLSEWHLGMWQWGETPTESTQGQFSVLERIIRECGLPAVWLSLMCVCECVWRLFSTTQGADLTAQRTDRFMALIRSARCAPGYSMCRSIHFTVQMCHPEAAPLLTDEASCGSHRGFCREEVRRNHS